MHHTEIILRANNPHLGCIKYQTLWAISELQIRSGSSMVIEGSVFEYRVQGRHFISVFLLLCMWGIKMCSLLWRSFLDTPCQPALDLWFPCRTSPFKHTALLKQFLAYFVRWSVIWSDSLLCVLKMPMASGCAGVPGSVPVSLCWLVGFEAAGGLCCNPQPVLHLPRGFRCLWHCQQLAGLSSTRTWSLHVSPAVWP